MAKTQGSDGLMGTREIAILNIDSFEYFFLGQASCQSACYNKFKMGLYVEFGWVMAVWEPKEKTMVDALMAPSPFNPPFWSFEFFYRTFYLNPKFLLICNQIDLAIENLCLSVILIFSAILFFFCSN
jgi:hypothetical protein